MKKLLTLLLLLASFGLMAQTQELEEAEIVIRKDRKIILPLATRNFEKVPQFPKLEIPDAQQYRFKSFGVNLAPFNPNIRMSAYRNQTQKSDFTGNYLKVGFGNYVTPFLEAYLGSKRAKDYLYNVYVRHMSSEQGPVAGKNSANGRTEAVVGGKYFDGTNAISGSLIYDRMRTHYYGYNPVLDLNSDDIEQVYNKFSAKFGVERTNKNVPYDYHFTTIWGFFKDKRDARENKFYFDMGGAYAINDEMEIRIDLLSTLSKRKDLTEVNRNYVNLMPRFNVSKDQFDLSAGFNVAGDNDSGRGVKVYPAIEAGYRLNSTFRVFAGYEGGVEMNTFESVVQENAWMTAGFDLRNTEKQSDIYGGASMELLENLDLTVKASQASLNDMTFITNDIADSTRFNILYDGGTTKRLAVSTALNYESKGVLRSSLHFDYYSYTLSTLAQAWHRPDFKVDFNNTFYPIDKLQLTADFYYMGGLMGLNGETGQAQKLEDIFDLNLSGRYDINNRFDVFIQINNVLGQNYQRYLNYPSRGLQAMGGVSVTF